MLPCNEEEAKLVLRKWAEDSTPLLLFIRARLFKSRNFSASCSVKVKVVTGNFLEIAAEFGGGLTVLLDECTFGYSEPGDMEGLLGDLFKQAFGSTLVITFPSELYVSLCELTTEGQQQQGPWPRFMF